LDLAHDGVDLDGAGQVVDEVDEHPHAGQGEGEGAGDGEAGYEGLLAGAPGADGVEPGGAVGEGADKHEPRWVMVNRTQALVLGFFVVALVSLLVILVAAPDVYDQALRLPDRSGVAEVAFLVVLTGFLGLLTVGVLRR
jgi:hypothetical protein